MDRRFTPQPATFEMVVIGMLLASIQPALAWSEIRPTQWDRFDKHRPIARSIANRQLQHKITAARNSSDAQPQSKASAFTLNFVSRDLPVVTRTKTSKQFIKSVQVGDQRGFLKVSNGVDLDLSSSNQNIVLGANLFRESKEVTINEGLGSKTYQAGSIVTASEYVAIKQVLSGRAQEISIGSNGSAQGGFIDLGVLTSGTTVMRAASLTVPVNVTARGDFSRTSDFRLLGNLNNFGTIQTYSSSDNVRAGSVRAENVYNESGATINTTKTDLAIFAKSDFFNAGSVSSEGSLTITAGKSISTSSRIEAIGELKLEAPSILNSGNVSSSNASVSFSSPGDLRVDNTSGTVSAAHSINIRETAYQDSFETSVSGGNFLANELNVHAGQGAAWINVEQVNGLVNSSGREAHLSTTTDTLRLGNICLTGDPTFKNDAGDILITGDIVVGEALSIIASGNIVDDTGVNIVTGGFPLTILAGAQQVSQGTNSSVVPGTPSGTTVTGGTIGGGYIKLKSQINTQAPLPQGDGGDVFLGAYGGTSSGAGVIDLTSGTIVTGGRKNSDVNGSVTISAASNIFVQSVNTTGGKKTSGDVVITTAPPVDIGPVVFDANGRITSDRPLMPGVITQAGPAGIVLKGTIAGAQNVTFESEGRIDFTPGSSISADDTLSLSAVGALGALTSVSPVLHAKNSISLYGNLGVGTVATPVMFTASQARVVSNGSIFLDTPSGLKAEYLYAEDSIFVNSGGSVTLDGISVAVSGTFAIDINRDGGDLTIKPNSIISAGTDIRLTNAGINKSDKIIFEHGSLIGTGPSGNVLIRLGALNGVNAKAPKNAVLIKESGGVIDFFGRRARSNERSYFIARGGNITVSSSGKKRNLIFNGTTIKASP